MGRIRLRRDTTANWIAADPVLARGEPALDLTRKLIKIGQGLPWSQTPYARFQQPIAHKEMHVEGAEDAITIADLHPQLASALPASYGVDNKLMTETELGALGIGTQIETVVTGTLIPQSNFHYIVTGDLTLQDPTLTAGILWSCTLRVSAGALLVFPATWKVTGSQDVDQPTMVYLTSADGVGIYAKLVSYPYTNPGASSRIHVATWGNDANDGRSWATAKRTVEAGATSAKAASHRTLWIAEGQYVPIATTGFDFSGLSVYGGFEGTETSIAERNYTAQPNDVGCPDFMHQTILTNPSANDINATYIVSCGEGSTVAVLNGLTLDASTFAVFGGAALTFCRVQNCANRSSDNNGIIRNCHLQNCTVTGNTILSYGAVYSCICDRCIISYNSSGRVGSTSQGAAASYSTISRSLITRNTSANSGGGTFNCHLSQCTISYNQSLDTSNSYGGGSHNTSYTYLSLDCVYEYNQAHSGGGLSKGTCYRCIFRYNTASRRGGACYDVTLYDCVLLYNTASGNGGACYYLATANVSNCIFIGNSCPAATNGGAIFSGAGPSTFQNSIFARTVGSNTIHANGTLYINNCLFLHNVAPTNQSAAYRNCIFWRNVSEGGTGGLNHFNSANGIALSTFVDPLDVVAQVPVANEAAFDAKVLAHGYDLAAGAVCINGGNDTYNTTTLDIRNRTRKVGTIDAGPYEYQS